MGVNVNESGSHNLSRGIQLHHSFLRDSSDPCNLASGNPYIRIKSRIAGAVHNSSVPDDGIKGFGLATHRQKENPIHQPYDAGDWVCLHDVSDDLLALLFSPGIAQ